MNENDNNKADSNSGVEQKKKDEKNKNNRTITIISSLVLIAVLAIGIIFILNGRASSTASTPPAPTEAAAMPTAEVKPTNTSPAPTDPPANTEPAPTATTAAVEASPPQTSLTGDMIRGGKLYDNWWEETEQDAPTDNNPLWATQTTNTRKGSSTWRCAECHGYDYKGVDGAFASGSHMTGFPGVLAAKGKAPEEILASLKGETNPDHDFSEYLEEQDLIDLSLFISQGTVDVSTFMNADGSPMGVAADGKAKFDEVCAACHGPNGTAIDFKVGPVVEYLAGPANGNPFQFAHRMRIGVALWPMPSAADNDLSEQDLANILAYVQTLPEEGGATSGGGQVYDKWYTFLGVNTPTEDQPLWKTQTTNTRKGTSTWTCRECHGIDYKGVDGEFASGSHMTGFPGVLAAKDMTEQQIIDALTGKTNPDHDFSAYLDETVIKAMVHFFQNEMVDFSGLVVDGKVQGDLVHGKELYTRTCALCHGEDGRAINFHAGQDVPEYVGTVAADEAYVLLHRVTFGVPGFPMSAAIDLGFSLTDIADVSAYAQTLPTK